MQRVLLLTTLLLSSPSPATAGNLRVYPPQVALTGPGAAQRLLVVEETAGEIRADRTAAAKFTSSNPAVADVSADGLVRAKADGKATVTVVVGARQTTVSVQAARTTVPPADPFRNEILPMMTRIGCNSGACHGRWRARAA